VPTASYFERQIKEGVYLPLDKSKLPNLRYMDGLLMSKVALHYVITPRVIADISNFKRYANADAQAQSLLDPSVRDDPGIYPPAEQRQKLAVQLADTTDQTRTITRVWEKFKTGH